MTNYSRFADVNQSKLLKMRMLLILLLSFSANLLLAQEYKAVPSSSKLSITGTSSLHNWEIVADTFSGKILAKVENNQLQSIEKFIFQLKANSLKSGKSAMDKKTYKALKEEDYSIITYQGNAVTLTENTATFSGTMSIAGTAKNFKAKAKFKYSNGEVSLIGSKVFKLKDFNIEPPSAVFGTIKTGDEVEIHYNLKLTINN